MKSKLTWAGLILLLLSPIILIVLSITFAEPTPPIDLLTPQEYSWNITGYDKKPNSSIDKYGEPGPPEHTWWGYEFYLRPIPQERVQQVVLSAMVAKAEKNGQTFYYYVLLRPGYMDPAKFLTDNGYTIVSSVYYAAFQENDAHNRNLYDETREKLIYWCEFAAETDKGAECWTLNY